MTQLEQIEFFDAKDMADDPQPCKVCLDLARKGQIAPDMVMPLPKFPARTWLDDYNGEQCCRDCQATETMMRMGFQHPMFGPARLTVGNERKEGLRMPLGMMQHFGLCKEGYIRPCSLEDLNWYLDWLKRHDIWDAAVDNEEDGGDLPSISQT